MPMVQHQGYSVEYLDEGQGLPVLLLHSSACGYWQWRRLVTLLAPHHRVLAPNLFGNGATSAWPPGRPQTLADQAQLAEAVAALAGGPVHLVGHSMGGLVAMKAAVLAPGRVRSLTLLEPNAFHLLRLSGAPEFAEVQTLGGWIKSHGAAGEWEALGEKFADYWNAPGAYAAMPPERRAPYLRMLPSVFHEVDAALAETMPADALLPVAARTLLVTAPQTRPPILAIARLLQEALPALRHETLPAGGHMAPLTHAELVNPMVAAHLARWD